MVIDPPGGQESRDCPVVLIGGAARSGTTVTRRVLGQHSQVQPIRTDWSVITRVPKLIELSGFERPRSRGDAASVNGGEMPTSRY